jgi:Tfp pilus assembly protein PilN
MKAVNLIPVEDRRGSGAPGRSGGAVYALLGGLGLVLLLVAVLFTLSHQISTKKQQLADVTTQAQTAETQAGSLEAYTQFASLRQKRQETVASLASSRFDWAHALHELARTVPAGASLTALRATVSSSTAVAGTTNPLRSALDVPALEMAGCAKDQSGVAELMAAMRRIDGVQRVSLSSSERSAKVSAKSVAGAPAPAGSAGSSCSAASGRPAVFAMVVFYDAPIRVGNPAAATGTATATSATTTTSSTTPAAATPAPANSTGGTK